MDRRRGTRRKGKKGEERGDFTEVELRVEPRVRCIYFAVVPKIVCFSMLRLFDVKGNVQQAKHRRIKCDEPGEVRRERSGGRRRRIEGEASLAAAAVKNAVYSSASNSFAFKSSAGQVQVQFGCVDVHPNCFC